MTDASRFLKGLTLNKQKTLTVPEDESSDWGREGEWPLMFFDLGKLGSEQVAGLAEVLGEAFLEEGDYFAVGDDDLPVWKKKTLVPFGMMGPAEFDLDMDFPHHPQIDGVLFLDLRKASGDQCPVLIWGSDESPQDMTKVCASVGDLLKLVK